MNRRRPFNKQFSRQVERLEPRNLLAASPVISEFMASNSEQWLDGDSIDSDWIEIFNDGDEAVDLAGWRLTDRSDQLDKWRFPSRSLAPNSSLLVYASGQDREYTDQQGNLHTNFKLSSSGEYLAIVDPTGIVHHEFANEFPQQRTNVSYGYAVETTHDALIDDAALQLLTQATPPLAWTEPEFEPDAAWADVDDNGSPLRLPLGYDVGDSPPGLIAAWNFKSAEPLQVDVSGAHQMLLPEEGASISASGPDNQAALSLDGSAAATIAPDAKLSSESFTFATWARVANNESQTLFANLSQQNDASGYRLHIDQGRWVFTTGDGTGRWQQLRGPSARVDQWQHIAIRYDASTLTKELFINGSRIVGGEAEFVPWIEGNTFLGGRTARGGFAGDITQVALFERALAGDEIANLVNSPITSSATGELNALIAGDIASVQNTSTTAFLRTTFASNANREINELWLEVKADDGFIAYLNGTEIARRFAPDDPLSESPTATQTNPLPTDTLRFDVSEHKQLLIDQNVLAVQIFNASLDDQDLFLDLQLNSIDHAIQRDQLGYFASPTPGEINGTEATPRLTTEEVVFTTPTNTFRDTVQVELTANGLPIYYTTDGSLPTRDANRYAAPLTLERTTPIRARVIEENAIAGAVANRTFMKLDAEVAAFESQLPVVIIDNFDGGDVPNSGWNQTNAGIQQVNRQPAMLSIYTPGAGGILQREAVTETRAGIRVRGAFSSSFPQPGYSVEAWGDTIDGDSALEILGMGEAADWVFYAPNPQYDRTLIDNSFMFELSNQLGHWAPEVRYVEVFLNEDGDAVEMSDHIGLFAIVEKVERTNDRLDFEKLTRDGVDGGWLLEINRMDSISETGVLPKNFHTAGPDGVVQTPGDLTNGSGRGDDIPRQYNAYINFDDPNGRELTSVQRDSIVGWMSRMEDVLYGRTAVEWNDPVEGYAKYIDVDNFIDYMHFNNLSHNGDGLLISMWLYNPDPSDGGKLRFGPIWDVDLGGFEGNASSNLVRRKDRLWYDRLFDDPNFEQRFTDRWFELRASAFADENLLQIIDTYRQQIGFAAATREGVPDWAGRLGAMESWVTTRAEAMQRAFVALPKFDPPDGEVTAGATIGVELTRGTVGDIYYTLDGSDPRLPGGEVSPLAILVTPESPLVANGILNVTARTNRGSRWSAPVVANFRTPIDLDLNRDGFINGVDVQTLCQAIIGQDADLDLTGDNQTDQQDLHQLLALGWDTSVGDANLDGRFDSTDLVQIFIAGRYEQELSATYASGDWNCDGKFDSGDLVTAFMLGNYVPE